MASAMEFYAILYMGVLMCCAAVITAAFTGALVVYIVEDAVK